MRLKHTLVVGWPQLRPLQTAVLPFALVKTTERLKFARPADSVRYENFVFKNCRQGVRRGGKAHDSYHQFQHQSRVVNSFLELPCSDINVGQDKSPRMAVRRVLVLTSVLEIMWKIQTLGLAPHPLFSIRKARWHILGACIWVPQLPLRIPATYAHRPFDYA